MLVGVFLALFLPCAGMSVVFLVYMCLLWYAATSGAVESTDQMKVAKGKGLSPADLEKLPKIAGKDLALGGGECAVCLDEIGADEAARMIPGCNHGFHVQCADTWLSKHSVCPVCRAKLLPELFDPPENSPC